MLDDVLGAEGLPAGCDLDVFEPAPQERGLHGLAVEVEQVLEFELHPSFAHQPRRPAVKARQRNEECAARTEEAPQVREVRQRVACMLDDVGQHRHVEGTFRQDRQWRSFPAVRNRLPAARSRRAPSSPSIRRR